MHQLWQIISETGWSAQTLVSSKTTTNCIQYYMAASKIWSKALQTLPPKEGQQLYLMRLQMKAIAQGLHSNDVSDRTIVA